jgi:hypothetical protein
LFNGFANTTLGGNLYANRPIMFFGNWDDMYGREIDHAFLCYGYEYDTVADSMSYRVHYGYTNYPSVYVSESAINAFGGWYKLSY